MFAPSAQLPKLLHDVDVKYLASYTACADMSEEKLIAAIVITHVEKETGACRDCQRM